MNCDRCRRELKRGEEVWLEMSINDGCYYRQGELPAGHESQGLFPFGQDCAATELKRYALTR